MKWVVYFFLANFFWAPISPAQQPRSTASSAGPSVNLVVIVTDRSGNPVRGLQPQDFTLYDNDSIRTIRSVRLFGEPKKPTVMSPRIDIADTQSRPTNDKLATFSAYEITFDPAVAAKPDEYHRIEIRIYRPRLQIVTQRGYYAQPK